MKLLKLCKNENKTNFALFLNLKLLKKYFFCVKNTIAHILRKFKKGKNKKSEIKKKRKIDFGRLLINELNIIYW